MFKKILAIVIVMLLLYPVADTYGDHKDKHKSKKEKRDKQKRKHDKIPIDGGLSAFAIAAGIAGIAILRRRETED